LERHLIPPDPALWKLDRFEDFVAERKKLIKAKFSYLLTAPVHPSHETHASSSIDSNSATGAQQPVATDG
jgi:hypothetical protein